MRCWRPLFRNLAGNQKRQLPFCRQLPVTHRAGKHRLYPYPLQYLINRGEVRLRAIIQILGISLAVNGNGHAIVVQPYLGAEAIVEPPTRKVPAVYHLLTVCGDKIVSHFLNCRYVQFVTHPTSIYKLCDIDIHALDAKTQRHHPVIVVPARRIINGQAACVYLAGIHLQLIH